MTDKLALRAHMRAVRDAFAAEGGHAIRVDAAVERLLLPGMVVASYVPVGGEADPAPLELAARGAGCILALPHVVDRATPLRFLRFDEGDALAAGPFGLRQPRGDAAALAPDLVLTPLVAFDAKLNRVGQGAGHYDRAFEAHPRAIRIGVAWSVQQVERIAADPWDAPLHAIATERDWITP